MFNEIRRLPDHVMVAALPDFRPFCDVRWDVMQDFIRHVSASRTKFATWQAAFNLERIGTVSWRACNCSVSLRQVQGTETGLEVRHRHALPRMSRKRTRAANEPSCLAEPMRLRDVNNRSTMLM